VIVNSSQGKAFHEEIGYRPRRWVELANGVNTQQFYPRFDMREKLRALLGIQTQGPVIGMVARYHPMKDHETFLRESCGPASWRDGTKRRRANVRPRAVRAKLNGEPLYRDGSHLRGNLSNETARELGLLTGINEIFANK
jgi:hypothetical protein